MNNTLSLNPPFSIFRCLILKREVNLKIFWLLSFILIISLSVFYIFQANLTIKETYLIQSYQKKLKELSQENQNMEINLSQTGSLTNLEGLIKNLNFEKVNKVYYIKVLEDQVVKK